MKYNCGAGEHDTLSEAVHCGDNHSIKDLEKECHCGKDGHALNSINCPVHGYYIVPKDVELESKSWQAKFLDTGTFSGCGDLSIMIMTVSELISQAKEEEKKAWLAGKRCTTCGNEIEVSPTNDTCDECWKNN